MDEHQKELVLELRKSLWAIYEEISNNEDFEEMFDTIMERGLVNDLIFSIDMVNRKC